MKGGGPRRRVSSTSHFNSDDADVDSTEHLSPQPPRPNRILPTLAMSEQKLLCEMDSVRGASQAWKRKSSRPGASRKEDNEAIQEIARSRESVTETKLKIETKNLKAMGLAAGGKLSKLRAVELLKSTTLPTTTVPSSGLLIS